MAQQPQLTKDHNQAHSDLDEYGYCLIEEALTPKEVETALTRLPSFRAHIHVVVISPVTTSYNLKLRQGR